MEQDILDFHWCTLQTKVQAITSLLDDPFWDHCRKVSEA